MCGIIAMAVIARCHNFKSSLEEAHAYFSLDGQMGRLHLLEFLNAVIAEGAGRPVVQEWQNWLELENSKLGQDQALISSLNREIWYSSGDIQFNGSDGVCAPCFQVVERIAETEFYALAGSDIKRESLDSMYTRLTTSFMIGHAQSHWKAVALPLVLPDELFNDLIEKVITRFRAHFDIVQARDFMKDPKPIIMRDRIPLPSDMMTHVALNSCPVALKLHQAVGMKEIKQVLDAFGLESTPGDVLNGLVAAREVCPSGKYCQVLLPIKPYYSRFCRASIRWNAW
jgi:hypothetical protein